METPADGARAYWDSVAHQKSFTHPLDLDVLTRFVPRKAALLDCGCGYGRLLVELGAVGYENLTGLDFSTEMLARAAEQAPEARLVLRQDESLPFDDASFDAALLVSVLTCIPDDPQLDRLCAEFARVLRPGGSLYISDCALGTDERNRLRYAAARDRGEAYGVFELDEGVRLRHFEPSAVADRLRGFTLAWQRELVVRTMNGNTHPAFQFLARRDTLG